MAQNKPDFTVHPKFLLLLTLLTVATFVANLQLVPQSKKALANPSSWAAQTSGTAKDLSDLDFIDTNNGWAVGSSGREIINTSNGGTNWSSQFSIGSGLLAGIDMFDANNGWAVGNNRTVYNTTNGGTNWNGQTPDSSGDGGSLDAVYAIDASNAYIVGSGGVIEKTTNGGTNWTDVDSGSASHKGVHCTDANTCWVVGSASTILKTTNGGTNWTAQTCNCGAANLQDVWCNDANTCWVAGQTGWTSRTTDGGTTWTGTQAGSTDLNGVHFRDASNGLVVGNSGVIYATGDGGATWTAQTSGTANAINDVRMVDNDNGWFVADTGVIHKGTNVAPTASGVAITGTTTADDLDVNFTNSDPGADTRKAAIDWRKGGTSIAIINGEFEADSSTGASAEDHSTHDQTMSVTGAVLDADGGVDGGGAYVFDGADDVIAVTEHASLDMTSGSVTIAAWINRAGVGVGGEQRILERSLNGGGSAAVYNLKVDTSTSKARTEIRVDFGANSFTRELISNSTIPLSTWTHLAATYDGFQIKLYINGVLDNSRVDIGTMDTGNNGGGLGIGNQVERNRPFHGSIDQLLLLNRALSQEQIQNLANQRPDLMSDKETLVGEEWVACVTPTDLIEEGSEVCSSGVTLVTQPAAVCGDGYIGTSETCDDANSTDSDGCINCILTAGYSCVNETNYPSECSFNWEDNKSTRQWALDYNVLDADASFLGDSADSLCLLAGRGGDLNGDGLNDVLLGDCSNNQAFNDAGKAYVFFGKTTGWAKDTALSTADASWLGDEASDFAAFNPKSIGDVNNDGYDDLAIDGFEPDFTGKVYVFFGKAAGWTTDTLLNTADASFVGETAGDSAAYIYRLGDVNNDGYDDFGIGANSRDEGPGSDDNGQFYLIFGRAASDPFWALGKDVGASADASWVGEAVDDFLGSRGAGVGDVNNDGYDDFILAVPSNDEAGSGAGQVYLIFGRATADPYWALDKNIGSTADASWLGETTNAFDQLGGYVAGNGDINKDGFNDFVIGATSNDDGGESAGQLYVIRGRAAGDSYWTMDKPIDTTADSSYLGKPGDFIGGFYHDLELEDLDNDGQADILVPTYFNSDFKTQAGKTYVILGGGSLQKDIAITNTENGANASFFGEALGDFLGLSIASLGDVNGDNRPDFIIAAPYNDQVANGAGKAYLFLSPLVVQTDSTPAPPPCPAVTGSIQTFTAQLGQSGDNSAIDLNWTFQGTGANEQATLYRGVGTNLTLPQMLPIAQNLPTSQTSYQDVFTQTSDYGKTYSYALQLHNNCGNTQNPQFSDPFTLPNRYSDGTEINMTLELSVKVKEVRDQLLLERIKEILQQNGSASLSPELTGYVQSFRQPSYRVAQAGQSDISITQFYQSDLRSRVRQAIHNFFFAPEELVTADPLKFDFYNRSKEFLFHRTVGHFIEQENLDPTDAQLNSFLQPLVDGLLNELTAAQNKEQELRTKLEQEGLHTINPNTLTSIDDILNNPNLKAAILSIPNIENLIKGHSESVLLEVWNPGDRNTPVFSQQITTNIFGEASVTLPNFVTGTYDFTLKLPGTLRKSVPIQKANTDTLALNFSGDDAGLKFGDFNDDGSIDLNDIKFLRTGFSQNPDQFDLNEDGKFDLSDIFETLKNYGTE